MAQGFNDLSNRINDLEDDDDFDAQATYQEAVRDLANDKVITGRQVRTLMRQGSKNQYDLSNLDVFSDDDGDTVQTGTYSRKSRKVAHGRAPKTARITPRMSDKEAEKVAKENLL
jgi:hypothetical protein